MSFGSRDSREEGEIPSFEEHHQEPANQIEDEDLARMPRIVQLLPNFMRQRVEKEKIFCAKMALNIYLTSRAKLKKVLYF